MRNEDRSCPDEELLLAFHGALPASRWLKAQLHRLVCPACRRRYRDFGQTSLALRAALAGTPPPLSARPGRLVPALATLLCLAALSALAWSAYSYQASPSDRCLTDDALLGEQAHCSPSPSLLKKR